MTDADPTMVRPREEVAKELHAQRHRIWQLHDPAPHPEVFTWEMDNEPFREQLRDEATAVLNRLRELGAFNDQFYDAIKAEDKRTK